VCCRATSGKARDNLRGSGEQDFSFGNRLPYTNRDQKEQKGLCSAVEKLLCHVGENNQAALVGGEPLQKSMSNLESELGLGRVKTPFPGSR
jgi:hypothetical protein